MAAVTVRLMVALCTATAAAWCGGARAVAVSGDADAMLVAGTMTVALGVSGYQAQLTGACGAPVPFTATVPDDGTPGVCSGFLAKGPFTPATCDAGFGTGTGSVAEPGGDVVSFTYTLVYAGAVAVLSAAPPAGGASEGALQGAAVGVAVVSPPLDGCTTMPASETYMFTMLLGAATEQAP